jgi:hypothetical protein
MGNREKDHSTLNLRTLRVEDYEDIRKIMDLIYPDMGGAWTKKQFESMVERFPEGQLGIEYEGHVVAAALSLIIDSTVYGDRHT